jgi:hypothetical protein
MSARYFDNAHHLRQASSVKAVMSAPRMSSVTPSISTKCGSSCHDLTWLPLSQPLCLPGTLSQSPGSPTYPLSHAPVRPETLHDTHQLIQNPPSDPPSHPDIFRPFPPFFRGMFHCVLFFFLLSPRGHPCLTTMSVAKASHFAGSAKPYITTPPHLSMPALLSVILTELIALNLLANGWLTTHICVKDILTELLLDHAAGKGGTHSGNGVRNTERRLLRLCALPCKGSRVWQSG